MIRNPEVEFLKLLCLKSGIVSDLSINYLLLICTCVSSSLKTTQNTLDSFNLISSKTSWFLPSDSFYNRTK